MMKQGEWKLYGRLWGLEKNPIFQLLREYALSEVRAVSARANKKAASPVDLIIKPMRFSGDMNTSLGNSIHNYLLIRSALECVGSPRLDTFVLEGDDALIALPRRLVAPFVARLEACGMRLKYEVFERPGLAGFTH